MASRAGSRTRGPPGAAAGRVPRLRGRRGGGPAVRRHAERGTFEHGASTLQLLRRPYGRPPARPRGDLRTRLFAARSRLRPQPTRDDKVVYRAETASRSRRLADGRVCCSCEPGYLAAARDCGLCCSLGSARRLTAGCAGTSRAGAVGSAAGVLEDHAGDLAEGLLGAAPGERRALASWTRAGEVLAVALDHFGDGAGRVLRHRRRRRAVGTPAARPLGQCDAVRVVVARGGARDLRGAHRVAAAPGGRGGGDRRAARHRRPVPARGRHRAWRSPKPGWPGRPRSPSSAAPPTNGPGPCTRRRCARPPPGAVLALGDGTEAAVPLLTGRGLVDGAPAAYVCRQFTCLAPVTTPEQLRKALAVPF